MAGRASSGPHTNRRWEAVLSDNPPLHVNQIFLGQENLWHPRCGELRRRYGLDDVVAGETDEFQRILLLRHWLMEHVRVDSDHPAPVREGVFTILDAALKGAAFHCTHFSLLQPALLGSFGYIARRLGVGPASSASEPGWHHGVNEVWVNSLCKWVLTDAKYNVHYEQDGIPLSALEVRAELLRDRGRAVRAVWGKDREPRDPHFFEGIDAYRWLSWELTPHFTAFPSERSSVCVVYEDEYVRTHTWHRQGKPHWAYAADCFLPVRNRAWIEWTPNVIGSDVRIAGGRAQIALRSCTPNFRAYQMRRGRGQWLDCADRLDLKLGEKGLDLTFRATNIAGVTGPEHRVRIVPANQSSQKSDS